MFVIGFAGLSGSGKTTLAEQVLARLAARGLRVSAVKSSHHHTDVDKPGKDSWRYRQAGAAEVALVGPERWAIMKETPDAPEPLANILARMAPVDIMLVEGYKSEEGLARIWVCREAFPASVPETWPEGLVAVATDIAGLDTGGLPALDVNDPGAVAGFVEGLWRRGSEN
ncbi:MAG: molybdopterin-guanine dinucleotide biosynthesis protein B [Duodenibacillus sp.]|nr:molybdopterin-guanine dinucleotide biosynthesis protein B [Duodenibacillus sp.]